MLCYIRDPVLIGVRAVSETLGDGNIRPSEENSRSEQTKFDYHLVNSQESTSQLARELAQRGLHSEFGEKRFVSKVITSALQTVSALLHRCPST